MLCWKKHPVCRKGSLPGDRRNPGSGQCKYEQEDNNMRQIARSIAREAMKRSGIKKINKKRPELGGRSYFAINWREEAEYVLTHSDRVYVGV